MVESVRRGSLGLSQNEAAGRDAGAGGDQDVLDVHDLVHRRAAHTWRTPLGDAVHAVQAGLAELAAAALSLAESTAGWFRCDTTRE